MAYVRTIIIVRKCKRAREWVKHVIQFVLKMNESEIQYNVNIFIQITTLTIVTITVTITAICYYVCM